jgi:hypothetical protein
LDADRCGIYAQALKRSQDRETDDDLGFNKGRQLRLPRKDLLGASPDGVSGNVGKSLKVDCSQFVKNVK